MREFDELPRLVMVANSPVFILRGSWSPNWGTKPWSALVESLGGAVTWLSKMTTSPTAHLLPLPAILRFMYPFSPCACPLVYESTLCLRQFFRRVPQELRLFLRLANADLLVLFQDQVRHPACPYRIRDVEACRLDAIGVCDVWELDFLGGYAATIPVWIQAGIRPRAEAELVLVAHEDDLVAATLIYPEVAQEVAEQACPTRT